MVCPQKKCHLSHFSLEDEEDYNKGKERMGGRRGFGVGDSELSCAV